jgi:hypothetical protein
MNYTHHCKEGAKSYDNEIDDFFIPTQLIFNAQVGGSRS